MASISNCRTIWCVLTLAVLVLAGCSGESRQECNLSQCCPEAGSDASTECELPDLLETARSGEEAKRALAIDLLGEAGAGLDRVVPALIELLEDDSPTIRSHAAQALGQIGESAKSAAEALVALVADQDKVVQREAVQALRNIRPGPEVTIPLFTKLLREATAEVRLYVMDALAELGPDAVEPLARALENEEACYWACLVLAEIGPDAADAVPALAKLLQTEEHLEVRREAILALAAIGPKAAPAVTELIGALDDTEGINASPAAYALGSIGPDAKAAEARLRELAENEKSPLMLQTVCLWALARMNPDDEDLVRAAVPRLIEGLKSPEREVREAAAQALIDLDPDPEITRPLMQKLMEDAGPSVLGEVLDALASLGEQAVPRLIKALEYAEARSKAAAIIARIGPAAGDAVPALIAAMEDDSEETRSEVLFALAAIGPGAKEAVPIIVEALADKEGDVRYAACYALGKIGPEAISAKADLRDNLDDEDYFLAISSAWALAQIDPRCVETCKKSVPVLVKALDDPDPVVRMHAAAALECLGPLAKEAVPALEKALKDKNEQVREAAAAAIKTIGE